MKRNSSFYAWSLRGLIASMPRRSMSSRSRGLTVVSRSSSAVSCPDKGLPYFCPMSTSHNSIGNTAVFETRTTGYQFAREVFIPVNRPRSRCLRKRPVDETDPVRSSERHSVVFAEVLEHVRRFALGRCERARQGARENELADLASQSQSVTRAVSAAQGNLEVLDEPITPKKSDRSAGGSR